MNKKAHGIMFHHFHDDHKHIVGQGSISAETFDRMLDFYSKEYHLINADEFLYKSQINTLKEDDVCITFDDGLLCQYDIAYPVLESRNLKAFFFVYTSPLDNVLEKIEIYRHFRFSCFKSIDEFYNAFFEILDIGNNVDLLKDYDENNFLKDFPFYTANDKKFRYLRDYVLGEKKYYEIMDKMIEKSDYDIDENSKLLWLNKDNILDLYKHNHIVGLHSYSHPTSMVIKSKQEQEYEYATNKKELEDIINDKVISVSYPCNSYNDDTLEFMCNNGIQIGFRANMADLDKKIAYLEYPREDHANILRQMEKEL